MARVGRGTRERGPGPPRPERAARMNRDASAAPARHAIERGPAGPLVVGAGQGRGHARHKYRRMIFF